jgi:hypothetical protein
MTSNSINNYLLLASDGMDANGGSYPALKILRYRLSNKIWGMNKRTWHRNEIKKDDNVIFYVAGRGVMHGNIMARAVIKDVKYYSRVYNSTYSNDSFSVEIPEKIIILGGVEYFKKNVNLKSLLGKISFLPLKKKWGIYLQGGARKISNKDFELILKRADY